MADMLVKLYTLPEAAPPLANVARRKIEIRRAEPTEKRIVADWAERIFSAGIAAACEAAIEQRPVTCFIAVEKQPVRFVEAEPYDLTPEIMAGFACYDVSARGMFGPEGVREDRRGQGVGAALLLTALHAMRAERYAYAIIGWAGQPEFYAKTVGARIIEGSEPGIYRGPLIGNPR